MRERIPDEILEFCGRPTYKQRLVGKIIQMLLLATVGVLFLLCFASCSMPISGSVTYRTQSGSKAGLRFQPWSKPSLFFKLRTPDKVSDSK